MIRTGGTWDPGGGNIYFPAGDFTSIMGIARGYCEFVLVALNEITTKDMNEQLDQLVECIDRGINLLIDSGVFALADSYAEKAGISMDEALATAPADIPGFDELLLRYLEVVGRIGARAWGYIEIDQGGRANKVATRAMLEKRGLRPIPVYHPLNDGWDYFDELASNYDRICLGNIVHANQASRLRLLATVWERCRKYPQLWVHILGLAPNEWLNAYPLGSCDSSSWLAPIRFVQGTRETVALKTFSYLDMNFRYDRSVASSHERGYQKGWGMAAYGVHLEMLNWRALRAEYEALGFNTRGGPC